MKTIFGGKTGMVLLLLVVLLLAGLPVAVWLDLTNLAETNLRRQASDLNSIISSVRGYYASNVVGRVLAAPGGRRKVAHNYETIPGAIPDPGDAVARTRQGDQRATAATSPTASSPTFRSRTARRITLDDVRDRRASPRCAKIPNQMIVRRCQRRCSATRVRLVAPVMMGAACVSLPQHPSGQPEARLEGRRRARHPGGHHHPADRRQHLLVQVPARLFRAGRGRRRLPSSRCSAARRRLIHGMNSRARDRQRLPRLDVDEDLALPVAADLQEHLQRPEGRHDPHRAQEADDLLFRHQGFHRHHRAAAAGADHRTAQRVFHRNVGDRARSTAARSTSSSATPC